MATKKKTISLQEFEDKIEAKGRKLVDIKILFHDLLSGLFTGSSHHFDEGEIVRASEITKEMSEKSGDTQHYPRYLIPDGCGVVNKALATTDISRKDYLRNINMLEKRQKEQMEKKAEIDKTLNYYGGRLVHLRKQLKNK